MINDKSKAQNSAYMLLEYTIDAMYANGLYADEELGNPLDVSQNMGP